MIEADEDQLMPTETISPTLTADADLAGSRYGVPPVVTGSIANESPGFRPGTRIRTPQGTVAVENLRIGDIIQTAFAGTQKIKWIGQRAYSDAFAAGTQPALPIRIWPGAIEDGIPARDLFIAPGHALFVEGALIPAWRLANGVSISQVESLERIEYFQIELDEHEIIFAEDGMAETLLDAGGHGNFRNGADFNARDPGAQPAIGLPRTESGFLLEAIRRRLAERAGLIIEALPDGELRGFIDLAGPETVFGWAQNAAAPEQPVCLDILAGATRITRILANQFRADLRNAGLGSGCHAFAVTLPPGTTGKIEVRRASDHAVLPLTDAALTQS